VESGNPREWISGRNAVRAGVRNKDGEAGSPTRSRSLFTAILRDRGGWPVISFPSHPRSINRSSRESGCGTLRGQRCMRFAVA
jgi:hypothetical protein